MGAAADSVAAMLAEAEAFASEMEEGVEEASATTKREKAEASMLMASAKVRQLVPSTLHTTVTLHFAWLRMVILKLTVSTSRRSAG